MTRRSADSNPLELATAGGNLVSLGQGDGELRLELLPKFSPNFRPELRQRFAQAQDLLVGSFHAGLTKGLAKAHVESSATDHALGKQGAMMRTAVLWSMMPHRTMEACACVTALRQRRLLIRLFAARRPVLERVLLLGVAKAALVAARQEFILVAIYNQTEDAFLSRWGFPVGGRQQRARGQIQEAIGQDPALLRDMEEARSSLKSRIWVLDTKKAEALLQEHMERHTAAAAAGTAPPAPLQSGGPQQVGAAVAMHTAATGCGSSELTAQGGESEGPAAEPPGGKEEGPPYGAADQDMGGAQGAERPLDGPLDVDVEGHVELGLGSSLGISSGDGGVRWAVTEEADEELRTVERAESARGLLAGGNARSQDPGRHWQRNGPGSGFFHGSGGAADASRGSGGCGRRDADGGSGGGGDSSCLGIAAAVTSGVAAAIGAAGWGSGALRRRVAGAAAAAAAALPPPPPASTAAPVKLPAATAPPAPAAGPVSVEEYGRPKKRVRFAWGTLEPGVNCRGHESASERAGEDVVASLDACTAAVPTPDSARAVEQQQQQQHGHRGRRDCGHRQQEPADSGSSGAPFGQSSNAGSQWRVLDPQAPAGPCNWRWQLPPLGEQVLAPSVVASQMLVQWVLLGSRRRLAGQALAAGEPAPMQTRQPPSLGANACGPVWAAAAPAAGAVAAGCGADSGPGPVTGASASAWVTGASEGVRWGGGGGVDAARGPGPGPKRASAHEAEAWAGAGAGANAGPQASARLELASRVVEHTYRMLRAVDLKDEEAARRTLDQWAAPCCCRCCYPLCVAPPAGGKNRPRCKGGASGAAGQEPRLVAPEVGGSPAEDAARPLPPSSLRAAAAAAAAGAGAATRAPPKPALRATPAAAPSPPVVAAPSLYVVAAPAEPAVGIAIEASVTPGIAPAPSAAQAQAEAAASGMWRAGAPSAAAAWGPGPGPCTGPQPAAAHRLRWHSFPSGSGLSQMMASAKPGASAAAALTVGGVSGAPAGAGTGAGGAPAACRRQPGQPIGPARSRQPKLLRVRVCPALLREARITQQLLTRQQLLEAGWGGTALRQMRAPPSPLPAPPESGTAAVGAGAGPVSTAAGLESVIAPLRKVLDGPAVAELDYKGPGTSGGLAELECASDGAGAVQDPPPRAATGPAARAPESPDVAADAIAAGSSVTSPSATAKASGKAVGEGQPGRAVTEAPAAAAANPANPAAATAATLLPEAVAEAGTETGAGPAVAAPPSPAGPSFQSPGPPAAESEQKTAAVAAGDEVTFCALAETVAALNALVWAHSARSSSGPQALLVPRSDVGAAGVLGGGMAMGLSASARTGMSPPPLPPLRRSPPTPMLPLGLGSIRGLSPRTGRPPCRSGCGIAAADGDSGSGSGGGRSCGFSFSKPCAAARTAGSNAGPSSAPGPPGQAADGPRGAEASYSTRGNDSGNHPPEASPGSGCNGPRDHHRCSSPAGPSLRVGAEDGAAAGPTRPGTAAREASPPPSTSADAASAGVPRAPQPRRSPSLPPAELGKGTKGTSLRGAVVTAAAAGDDRQLEALAVRLMAPPPLGHGLLDAEPMAMDFNNGLWYKARAEAVLDGTRVRLKFCGYDEWVERTLADHSVWWGPSYSDGRGVFGIRWKCADKDSGAWVPLPWGAAFQHLDVQQVKAALRYAAGVRPASMGGKRRAGGYASGRGRAGKRVNANSAGGSRGTGGPADGMVAGDGAARVAAAEHLAEDVMGPCSVPERRRRYQPTSPPGACRRGAAGAAAAAAAAGACLGPLACWLPQTVLTAAVCLTMWIRGLMPGPGLQLARPRQHLGPSQPPTCWTSPAAAAPEPAAAAAAATKKRDRSGGGSDPAATPAAFASAAAAAGATPAAGGVGAAGGQGGSTGERGAAARAAGRLGRKSVRLKHAAMLFGNAAEPAVELYGMPAPLPCNGGAQADGFDAHAATTGSDAVAAVQ